MVDLNKLSDAARSAAMRGGTAGWGQHASLSEHVAYVETLTGDKRRRRKCHCGCGKKSTHGLYANGLIMASGCEMKMRRLLRRYSSTASAREGE